MSRFFTKLSLFLAPFMAVFSLPAFVLGVSGEVLSADEIARKHFEGDRAAIYGPAYTNPDARYKLASIRLRQPALLAIGSSRALEFRADLFTGGDRVFYNAGSLAERLYEFRRALAHLPPGACKELIIVLDQWSFNENWPNAVDNPLFERELSGGGSDILNSLQRAARLTWRDVASGHLELGAVVQGGEHLGVTARVRGDGFRWDGSYSYAEAIRNPAAAKDYQFKDTLDRVATGTRRFEFGDAVDGAALEELRLLLSEARKRDIEVVTYLPPFAPTVARALVESKGHRYLREIAPAVRPIVEQAGYAFFDFTSCVPLGCTDAEFVDGLHPGSTANARLLITMADSVPWLDSRVDQAELATRIASSTAGPELAYPEHR